MPTWSVTRIQISPCSRRSVFSTIRCRARPMDDSRSRTIGAPHDGRRIVVESFTSLSRVDATEWDAVVPRDTPHLRYGFMEAIERSGFMRRPYYLGARRDGRLIGV